MSKINVQRLYGRQNDKELLIRKKKAEWQLKLCFSRKIGVLEKEQFRCGTKKKFG
jgi:hypothetical protein